MGKISGRDDVITADLQALSAPPETAPERPLELSAPNRWHDRRYHDMVLRSAGELGAPEAAMKLFGEILGQGGIGSFADFVAEGRRRANAMGEPDGSRVKEFLSEFEATAQYNDTCYITDTPEKSRAIRWPNNPRLKRQRPNQYFDIHETDFCRETPRFITKSTAIGSAGSCFATRIAHQLQAWGYNYLLEEDDLPDGYSTDHLADSVFRESSARLGNLFHPASLRLMAERGFGLHDPEKFMIRDVKRGWMDPFRHVFAYYQDEAGFLRDYDNHTAAIRRALEKAEVFIITLGSTEAWRFAHSGDYLAGSPHAAIDGCLMRRKEFSVQDSVAELEQFHAVMTRFNPGVKIIVTVSPVPLNKTYSESRHVVPATMLAKSKLLVAANEYQANHQGEVFYLPSFETVMYGTANPWQDDKRHVSLAAVRRVMNLFQHMFLADQSPLPPLKFTEDYNHQPKIGGRLKRFLRL